MQKISFNIKNVEDGFSLDDDEPDITAQETAKSLVLSRKKKQSQSQPPSNLNNMMRVQSSAKIWMKTGKAKDKKLPPKLTQYWATAAAFLEPTAPTKDYYIQQARREKEEKDQWEEDVPKVAAKMGEGDRQEQQVAPITSCPPRVSPISTEGNSSEYKANSFQRRRRRRLMEQRQQGKPRHTLRSTQRFTVHPGDVFIRTVKTEEAPFFKVDHVDTLRRMAYDEQNQEEDWNKLLDESKFKLVLNANHVHPAEVEEAEERMSQSSYATPYSKYSYRSREPSSGFPLDDDSSFDTNGLMSVSSEMSLHAEVVPANTLIKHFDGGWAAKQSFFERYRMQNPYQRVEGGLPDTQSKSLPLTPVSQMGNFSTTNEVAKFPFEDMQQLLNRPESAETRFMTNISTCGLYPLPMLSDLGDPECPSINFRNKKIGKNFLQPFCEAVKSLHFLKIVDITGNGLDSEGMCAILDALVGKPLLELNVGKNNLAGPVGCQSLAKLLSCDSSNKLKVLGLAHTGVGDRGLPCLAQALLSHDLIEELDLQGNEITARGIAALSHFFTCETSLTKLNLSWNSLGNAGLVEVCSAFSHHHNTLLKEVDFSWNGINVETSPRHVSHRRRKGSGGETTVLSGDVVGSARRMLESCHGLQKLNLSFNRFCKAAVENLMTLSESEKEYTSSSLQILLQGNTIPLTELKDHDKDRVKEVIDLIRRQELLY
mmetsp:Transcript_32068/g.42292  ORF Transcript_32068/g.42292 Transcript_32068/m.42292 type:complete len:710 (-) Transcript_32068:129-2258(-)